MEAKAVDADVIFKAFTACGKDPKTLLLDVRPHKDYKKGHINQAFNPRLATNGKFLADYSQSSYSMPWSQVGMSLCCHAVWQTCSCLCMVSDVFGVGCHSRCWRVIRACCVVAWPGHV